MSNALDYICKKYKIEDIQNKWVVEIPNMGRDQMAELFKELNYRSGVEVGVFKGKYSEILCKANPNAEIYGVDAWKLDAHPAGVFGHGTTQYYFDKCYNETVERMKPYKNYQIIKELSVEAAKKFADNSMDFCYIDAGHDFLNFTLDLHYWLAKVRSGGIMSGHDWAYYPFDKYIHVKYVLQAYMKCYNLRPFFIVGAAATDQGLIRDRYRSWFFVRT
jgi:hypothetical protein